jgi:hypothetical protein
MLPVEIQPAAMRAVGNAIFQKIFAAIGAMKFFSGKMLRNEFCVLLTHPKFYLQGEHGIYISVDAGKPHGFVWN